MTNRYLNKKIIIFILYLQQIFRKSFILDDTKKVNNNESQNLEKRTEDILSIFPLSTDDELLAIERKLKDEDSSYTQKLVSNI